MGRDRIAGPALYSCMACCCGVSMPALTQHAHCAAAAAQIAHTCQIAAGQGAAVPTVQVDNAALTLMAGCWSAEHGRRLARTHGCCVSP